MDIEVVVNCAAGSAEAADAERTRILEAFALHGEEPRVAVVVGDALASAVEAAIERGADILVVGGGDGTLGTAARAVAAAEVTLGVLPMGTFNHFAKDLGLPLDLDEAARVVVEGDTTTVDLGEVNDHVFVNNSSLGVYPVLVDVRDDIIGGRGWGKVRAAAVAGWRVLRRFPLRRLHIHAAGEQWDLRTPFVFIGNNSYEVGPTGIGARTEMAQGQLCCYVAQVESRLGFLRMAVSAATRGSAQAPTLESVCTGDLEVRAHEHRILVALDGEITTLRAPLRYRSRPGALRVRVPTDRAAGPSSADAPEAGAGVETDADADSDSDESSPAAARASQE
ncbi:MAG: diacylglycerol/lipid kinase family protein [Iamia sp.]